MSDLHRISTAVVIPARNEERRIGAALRALGPQLGENAIIVLVANNCTDDTVGAARTALPGTRLLVVECALEHGQGAGTARRLGCETAIRAALGLRALLTTDADCRVAPDWIAANLRHLAEVDAVCGAVSPLEEEAAILRLMPVEEGQNEALYRGLVQQFYALIHPEPHNPLPHHGEAPGASLGFTCAAYQRAGGFADRLTGEDRDLIRRLRLNGLRVRHASDVKVAASCRLTGRAPGGMAQALQDRLAGNGYRVDDALPPSEWLITQAREGTLPVWPPEVPESLCLLPADLPREIAALQALLQPMTRPEGMTRAVSHQPDMPSLPA